MSIEIANESGIDVDEAALSAVARHTLDQLGVSPLAELSVIVVEPGCKPKAFQKEDGSSMIRFEMAFGKAYAALALGRNSKLVRVRAQEKPIFMD